MSIHEEIESQLSAYLDGELGQEERVRVDEHLSGCAACSARLEELRAAAAAVGKLPEVEVPEDVARKLSAAVSAEYRGLKREPAQVSGRWSPFPAYAAAAAVVVGLAVLLVVQSLPPQGEVTAPSTGIERGAETLKEVAPAGAPEERGDAAGRSVPGEEATGAEPGGEAEVAPAPGTADISPASPGAQSPARRFAPEVVITETEHQGDLEEALDQLAGLPVAREAAGAESPAETAAHREQVIAEMTALAEKKGADPSKLRRALLVSLDGAPSDAVPARAELIRHRGTDVWLILHAVSGPEDGVQAVAVDADSGKPLSTLARPR